MASGGPPTKVYVDSDGVRVGVGRGVRPAVWLLAAALLLVGGAAMMLVQPGFQSNVEGKATPRSESAAVKSVGAADAGAPAVKPFRAVPAAGEPHSAGVPESGPTAPGERPPQDVAVAGQDVENEPSGIALFPPMGSKPVKRGIVVPEGFELPPGYVRHYQATDDGELLPPILMFHPDYELVDEHGARLPLPEDRVVPPALAPPGMPVQMLQLPEDEGKRDSPR